MLIPLLTLSAGAVELANVMRMKDVLQHASDASAIAAVAVNSPAAIAAGSMTSDGPIPAGVTDAKNVFTANVGNMGGYTAPLGFTPVVVKAGLSITATNTYSATVPTIFMSLIGMSNWTIGGTSYATGTLAPYVDFYLLLDNTPSMGIGATQADITKMVTLTTATSHSSSYIQNNSQCAFACHDVSQGSNDYYSLAKANNVTMRIDVVRLATQNLMTTAMSSQQMAGEFRAAVYTFGLSAATAILTPVAPLSSNLTTVQTQAGAVDVMSTPSQGYNNDQQTDYDATLAAMNLLIPTPGDGSSASTPQKILFFVTDGVADAYYPTNCSQTSPGGGRCQEPINVADCTAIKNRGIKIAVLYTTYYPLTTNSWYNSTVAPWASQIPVNMQSCASPGLYFQVSPSQGISDAMTALFLQAIRTVRMTQ